MQVYLNATLRNKEELGEILEPGFLFGWGVFEPLRVYGGKIAFLGEHLSRLKNSCGLLNLETPKVDWEKEIQSLLKENRLSDAYLRLTVYKKRSSVGTIIYADDFKYYASHAYANGFTTMISDIRRNENDIACRVKTISYLNNRLAWAQAQAAGKDEALMLNLKEGFCGGARSNLFLIKNKNVLTPALEDGAFCGITRQTVIRILKDLKFKVYEKTLKPKDLLECDEAFLTSALLEVIAVVSCGDRAIGNGKPGENVLRLRKQYQKLI